MAAEDGGGMDWRWNLMITFPAAESETDSDLEEEEVVETSNGKGVTDERSLREDEVTTGENGNIDLPERALPVENIKIVVETVDAIIQTQTILVTEEVVEVLKIDHSTQTLEEEQEDESLNIPSGIHMKNIPFPIVNLEEDFDIHQKKKKPEKKNRERYQDLEELNHELFEQYGDEKTIEKEILKRKLSLECYAEKSARTRQAQWVHDHISLEQAIDELFSDHLLLHEKAHALRLHFEREKNLWSKAIQQKLENWKDQERIVHPQRSFGSSGNSRQSENEEDMWRNLTPPMSPTIANWKSKDQTEDEFEYFQPLPKSHNTSQDEIPKDLLPSTSSNRPYRFPSRIPSAET